MGDGWETRRRREEGNDWVLISLARAGTIRKVIVDTAHFKGNYPESCSIQGMNKQNVVIDTLERRSEDWPVLLPRVKLQADTEHQFTKEIIQLGPITHVRLNIYPDGGVSRLRLLADVSSFEKT